VWPAAETTLLPPAAPRVKRVPAQVRRVPSRFADSAEPPPSRPPVKRVPSPTMPTWLKAVASDACVPAGGAAGGAARLPDAAAAGGGWAKWWRGAGRGRVGGGAVRNPAETADAVPRPVRPETLYETGASSVVPVPTPVGP